jgi:hypothetical protein
VSDIPRTRRRPSSPLPELCRQLELPSTLQLTVADADRARQVGITLGLFAEATVVNRTHLSVSPKTMDVRTETLVSRLVHAGIPIREVVASAPNLTDVFFALVQCERSIP